MKRIIIKFINFYQKNISQLVGSKGIHCKFYPSCSEYMKQAIKKYGVLKGGALGTKRLLKCHPFAKGGYDPLK